MKLEIAVCILVAACLPSVAADVESARLDDLAWMAGNWSGERGGVETEEHWTEPRGGIMLGVHRDVMASGKAAFEYLRIERDAEGIVYMASPQGREPTPFRLVEIGEQRAVFENPRHDFPQKLTYWIEEGKLHARVESEHGGRRRAIEWSWKRNR